VGAAGGGAGAAAFRESNLSLPLLRGHALRATVLSVGRKGVLCDPGFKSLVRFLPHEVNGRHVAERPGVEGPPGADAEVQEGDVLELQVHDLEGPDGEMVAVPVEVGSRGRRVLVWEAIRAAFAGREKIPGRILNAVAGGYAVGIGGFVAFMPESRAPQTLKALRARLGKLLEFDVIGLNEANQNIVVALLPQQNRNRRRHHGARGTTGSPAPGGARPGGRAAPPAKDGQGGAAKGLTAPGAGGRGTPSSA